MENKKSCNTKTCVFIMFQTLLVHNFFFENVMVSEVKNLRFCKISTFCKNINSKIRPINLKYYYNDYRQP